MSVIIQIQTQSTAYFKSMKLLLFVFAQFNPLTTGPDYIRFFFSTLSTTF